MKIIVDADACPKGVLQYTIKSGQIHNIEVITVANYNHNINSDKHIVVGGDSQESDIKIINLTEPGDIIITQDWGLAGLILAKNAAAISPTGSKYLKEKMDFMLEEREIKAKFRRQGGRTKGPSKRTPKDDTKFAATLDKVITEMSPNQ